MHYPVFIIIVGLLSLYKMPANSFAIYSESSELQNNSFKNSTLIKIYIEGMSCQRCVQKIEKKVKAIKGVRNVNMFLEEKYALIVFVKKTTTIKTIIAEIETAGYVVSKYEIIKIKKT